MKRCLILFPVLALTACSPQKTAVSIATPSNVETVAETVEAVIDTAYGKPCMYVEADAEYSELTCAKGIYSMTGQPQQTAGRRLLLERRNTFIKCTQMVSFYYHSTMVAMCTLL